MKKDWGYATEHHPGSILRSRCFLLSQALNTNIFCFCAYEVSTATSWKIWKAKTSTEKFHYLAIIAANVLVHFLSGLVFLPACVILDCSSLRNFWKHSGLCSYRSLSLSFSICGWSSGFGEFTVFSSPCLLRSITPSRAHWPLSMYFLTEAVAWKRSGENWGKWQKVLNISLLGVHWLFPTTANFSLSDSLVSSSTPLQPNHHLDPWSTHIQLNIMFLY